MNPKRTVTCFAGSRDGKSLATDVVGDFVGSTIILRSAFPLSSALSRARQIANRNLSLAEWRQFFPGDTYRKTFADLSAPDDLADR
jgi:hypothetical protein